MDMSSFAFFFWQINFCTRSVEILCVCLCMCFLSLNQNMTTIPWDSMNPDSLLAERPRDRN